MSAKIKITIAMMIFGTVGLFVRNINLPSAEIALYRSIIASLILSVYLLGNKRFKSSLLGLKKNFLKLFLSGIALSINWIFLFEAFNHTSIALSTLSCYFAPTLIVIFSSIIFKEKLSTKQILCFIGSTAGLVFIIGISGGGGEGDVYGVLFGLGAACFYASNVIINKSVKDIDPVAGTLCQFIAAVIALIPYVFLTGGFNISGIDLIGLGSLAVLGILHTGILYCVYYSSLSKINGQQAAIISYLDPLTSVIVSVVILSEKITVWQLLGGIAILLFTFINEVDIKRLFSVKKTNNVGVF